MIKILLILSLLGCNGAQFGSQVVIEPIDAIRLCEGKIKSYNALSGRVVCKEVLDESK